MLSFAYTLDGTITEVLHGEDRTWRQNLAAEAIDTAAAAELLARSHLVIAHSASFDRPFVERIVPAARYAAWACSRHEVPWDPAALPSRAS